MLPWDRVFLPWSPQVFSLIPLKLLFGSYVWNSLWLCLITCNCVWLKPCTRICSYKSEWQRACAGKRKGQHTPLFLFFKKLNKCRSTPLGSSSTFISYTISITLQDRRTIPRVIYQLSKWPVLWALAKRGAKRRNIFSRILLYFNQNFNEEIIEEIVSQCILSC
jgi:hypothetical protein